MQVHEGIFKEPNCIVFSNIKFLVLPKFCQINKNYKGLALYSLLVVFIVFKIKFMLVNSLHIHFDRTFA